MSRSYEFLNHPEGGRREGFVDRILREQRAEAEKSAGKKKGIDIEPPATDEGKRKKQQRRINNRRTFGIYKTSNAPETTIDEYVNALGLELDKLKGKLVLDIGAGQFLKFAREASADHGVQVISINPELAFSTGKFFELSKAEAAAEKEEDPQREESIGPHLDKVVDMNAGLLRRYAKESGQPAVAAYVQELPFADKSFDCEVSLNGVPGYLPEFQEEYDKAFSEVIRTLKPGGEARFFPIDENIYEADYFKTLLDKLKKDGHSAKLEMVVDKRMRLVIRKKEEK